MMIQNFQVGTGNAIAVLLYSYHLKGKEMQHDGFHIPLNDRYFLGSFGHLFNRHLSLSERQAMSESLDESFEKAKQAEEEKNAPLTRPKIEDGRMVFERPNPTPEEAPY